MNIGPELLGKIDALHDMAREFVERDQIHGIAVEYEYNACVFDQWRRKVNDLLYSLGGCEDIYYQRFSREVVQPRIKDLEEGLRILSAVRDDVARALHKQTGELHGEVPAVRLSVSYH
ncbi:MAG: hypothetical protein WBG50_06330 [Desulfomonilaceae bacterium]